MVNLSEPGASAETDGRGKPRQQPFAIRGNGIQFTPFIFPERVQVTKERNLDRKQDYCAGEDVTDNGSKNRDIHISGRLTNEELQSLDRLGNSDNTHTMVSATWNGEVRVATIEYEGPVGWYPPANSMLWKYRIDLVSTGKDERDGEQSIEDGIISEGVDVPDQLVE